MPLKIAILGTRGVPANYGGFETFAEQLGARLARRGHQVWVYGRSHYIPSDCQLHRGIRIRRLPSIRTKYLETVSHTTLSVLDVVFRDYDTILLCNAANAFLSWIPRLRFQQVVLNVDGIERLRRKWSWVGRKFYHLNERLATWFPNEIVTDAQTILRYYRETYGCRARYIPYGAPVESAESDEVIRRLGLPSGDYLLYVSRLEPENNADLVIEGYLRSGIKEPLVLVGDAPYSRKYIARLREMASRGNILMPGAIYGDGYRELLTHSLCYLHATEVGGTHPALLEAMGAGALVIANDTPENREVLGETGLICRFSDTVTLAGLIRKAVAGGEDLWALRRRAKCRIRDMYDWERVTDQYEELFNELAG